MYKSIIRPLLFLADPENVHHFIFSMLKGTCAVPGVKSLLKSSFVKNDERLVVNKMGLQFPNPVGLAAGFDKDAKLYNELSCLGFGFVEVGTLTPKAQPGNERPRLFRLPLCKALINRMGFNNDGAEVARRRLSRKKNVIIGGNIGKNKTTPNENAVEDYISAFNSLFDVVDYFVVNVSSPNTPGLRQLQEKEPLMKLLKTLQELNLKKPFPKPVLLKIAPDLTPQQVDEVIDIVKETQLAGIIASNTTISREGIEKSEKHAGEQGGLSGQPLKDRSTEMIRYIRQRSGPDLVIIGVGGIFTGVDAHDKLSAGADLVQVYTGFIYEGPSMVKRICRYLLAVNKD